MSFIVTAITSILGYFLKNATYKLLTLPIKIAIYGFVAFAVTAYISAYLLFFDFLFKIVNMFYSYINHFNSLNVGSGSAYGVSLSTIWSVFVGFMSASGLGTAFYVSVNLFITLLFSYLGVKVVISVGRVFKEVAKLVSNTGDLV